jgi:hypothetical protein
MNRQYNWDWIAEGAAIEVQLGGRAAVHAEKVRTRAAGLIVNLQLIRAGRGHRYIGERN